MKFYITSCFLFLMLLSSKADDLTFTVKNTVKGGTTGEIDLSINGGVSPYIISWVGPNGFTAKTEDIDNLAAGTYTVFVTDNYCGIATSVITVKDFITGIDELNSENVIVFPNPATTDVKISFPESFKNYQFKIINACGEILIEKNNLVTSFLTLDVANFDSGIYFIEIKKDNLFLRKKIIKY